ncbi:MAG: hypothetical protein PUD59_02880 [bacterium]|nr:hypothetical protein [bacterium]
MTIDDKKTAIATIEERFECKLDDLKEITDIIYKTYRNTFSYKQLYGEDNFFIIVQNTSNKDKNAYWTLSEKCIKRSRDLYELDNKLKDYNIAIKGLQEAKALNVIIERLIPSEIFWAMEEQMEDGYTFSEHEQKCYDYLEDVATFFLDKTSPFAEGLNNLNFAVDKVKKLGGKSWLNTKK